MATVERRFRTGVWELPHAGRVEACAHAQYSASREAWNILLAAVHLVRVNGPAWDRSIRLDMIRLLRDTCESLEQDHARPEETLDLGPEVQHLITDQGVVTQTFASHAMTET